MNGTSTGQLPSFRLLSRKSQELGLIDSGYGGYLKFSVPVYRLLLFDCSSRPSIVKTKAPRHYGGGDGIKVSTAQLRVSTEDSF